MTKNEIMKYVDHTLLLQGATWDDIKAICDDGLKYGTASVCIPPSYVKEAAEYLGGRLAVCTVIGFPNGYNTTKIKCAETADAIENGAEEIDMVINIGDLKGGRYDRILEEIKACKTMEELELCLEKARADVAASKAVQYNLACNNEETHDSTCHSLYCCYRAWLKSKGIIK